MTFKEITTGTAVARSLIIHGAAFLAMATAPSLKMMPEGTSTTTVEIVNTAPPKGQQVKTMKPTAVVEPPATSAAQAPIVAKEVVIPKAKKVKQAVVPPPAKVAKKKSRAKTKSAQGKSVRDMNGEVATLAAEKEKLRRQMKKMEDEMRQARLAQIAREEQEELRKKEEAERQRESLAAALAAERAKILEDQKKRDLEQQAAIQSALAAQKAEMDAKNAALAKELEAQRAAQATALAKANRVIDGQGKQLNHLKNNNQKLAAANQGMANAMQENLAYGLPTGTRDVRNLRQVSGNVPPQYPYRDRLAKRQGKVLLHYYVSSQGYVSNVRVVKSSGHQTLDREAARALSKYRFYPGQQGSTKHWVNFSLVGKAQSLTGGLKTQ